LVIGEFLFSILGRPPWISKQLPGSVGQTGNGGGEGGVRLNRPGAGGTPGRPSVARGGVSRNLNFSTIQGAGTSAARQGGNTNLWKKRGNPAGGKTDPTRGGAGGAVARNLDRVGSAGEKKNGEKKTGRAENTGGGARVPAGWGGTEQRWGQGGARAPGARGAESSWGKKQKGPTVRRFKRQTKAEALRPVRHESLRAGMY